MERLVLESENHHIPADVSQHSFHLGRSTTTALTSITQDIIEGFNQRKPPSRTVMVAMDISKAFDTVKTPTHKQDTQQPLEMAC